MCRRKIMNWKDLSKKDLRNFILSIAMIVFGILFCVLSKSMLNLVETVLCFASLIYGAFYLISYCLISSDTKEIQTLFQAMVAIVIGFMLMFIRSFFVMAVGILIALTGVSRIVISVKKKKFGEKDWWHELVVGIVLFALGTVLAILCNTNVASIVVMIYLGVLLILVGGLNIYVVYAKNKIPVTKGLLADQMKTKEPEVESEKVVEQTKTEEVEVQEQQEETVEQQVETEDDGEFLL